MISGSRRDSVGGGDSSRIFPSSRSRLDSMFHVLREPTRFGGVGVVAENVSVFSGSRPGSVGKGGG